MENDTYDFSYCCGLVYRVGRELQNCILIKAWLGCEFLKVWSSISVVEVNSAAVGSGGVPQVYDRRFQRTRSTFKLSSNFNYLCDAVLNKYMFLFGGLKEEGMKRDREINAYKEEQKLLQNQSLSTHSSINIWKFTSKEKRCRWRAFGHHMLVLTTYMYQFTLLKARMIS